MNWGKGIIAVCALFITGIGVMVYTSMTKNIDLVTKNYYEEEIKYQQQIDKINNSSRLKEKVMVETVDNAITVTFPKQNGSVNGEISVYRPSDAKKDFKVPIQLNSDSKQVIPTDKMQKGLWKVQITWNMNGTDYYNEEKIIIR